MLDDDGSLPLYLAYCALLMFNIIVTIPTALYYCYLILHQSSTRIFHKRYPQLTISCVLSFLIIHLLAKPICDIPTFFDLHLAFDARYLYPYFGYLPWALILVRGWYLFYDYKHGMHLVQSEWSYTLKQSRLNIMDTMQRTAHWTARYQSVLSGNSKYPIYFALFWVVLADILSIVLMTFDYRVADMVYASFSLIVVIAALFIIINVQSVKDTLYIADELKLLSVVGVMTVAFYVAAAMVFEHTDPLRAVMLYAGLTVFTGLETYISTKWVIDQFHKRRRRSITQSQINGAVSLSMLLKSKEGFEAFAAHLVHEFCIENLLFLFEAMHFKMQCLRSGLIRYRYAGVMMEFDHEIMNLDDDPDAHSHRRKSSNPRTLTTSQSDGGGGDPSATISNMDEFYANFHYIVDRYVYEHSEYSINISYETRTRFFSLLHQISKSNESASRITQLFNGTLNALKKKLSNPHHHHVDMARGHKAATVGGIGGIGNIGNIGNIGERALSDTMKGTNSNSTKSTECKSDEDLSSSPQFSGTLGPHESRSGSAPPFPIGTESEAHSPDFVMEEEVRIEVVDRVTTPESDGSHPALIGLQRSDTVTSTHKKHDEAECRRVIEVMDVAVDEVFRLLSSDIFPRFRQTDAFRKLNDTVDGAMT